MKFDLMISDYDWTLGTKEGIKEDTLKAIREFVDKGGKFVVCTGRVADSIQKICLDVGFKGLVATYQGSMILDIESSKIIFNGGLNKDVAKKIIADYRKLNADITVDIGRERFWEEHNGLMHAYVEHGGTAGEKNDDLIKTVDENNGVIEKVCAMVMPEDVIKYQPVLNGKYSDGVVFNSGADILIEAVNPKYGKGNAVKIIADYYNIPLERVITVGDSTNDIPLVQGEWYGVAVGDANEELKKVAKEVVVPFNDQPIKYLLEKYCL